MKIDDLLKEYEEAVHRDVERKTEAIEAAGDLIQALFDRLDRIIALLEET